METTNKQTKAPITTQGEVIFDLGLITKTEVARLLKVSITTVDRWVKLGYLKRKKMGEVKQAKVFFQIDEVKAFAKTNNI